MLPFCFCFCLHLLCLDIMLIKKDPTKCLSPDSHPSGTFGVSGVVDKVEVACIDNA